MLRWKDKIRPAGAALLALAGVAIFAYVVNGHYPLKEWLFWHYATYWVCCGVFSLAALSVGHLVISKVLGHPLPVHEHLGTAFAIGVFGWFLAMFFAGVGGVYGSTAAFFAIPMLLISIGAPGLVRYLLRLRRGLLRARKTAEPPRLVHYAVLGFGLLGLVLVYCIMFHPENVQFDARWKHLALAEEYAAHGAIRRFPEGWTVATYPHLVSYVFTWGFMLPGGTLYDHVELCAHLELTCLLWMLVSIGGTVRMLVPNAPAGLVWAARFLFPGVFLYDSSLAGGADHIAALFALPIFTLMVRVYRDLRPGYAALLAVVMVGAAMVKYTSAILLFPIPAAVLVGRGLYLGARRGKRRPGHEQDWWRGPVTALVVGLVVSAPHWLKNIVWYGDPVYPVLHSKLTVNPWFGQDATDMYKWGYQDYQFWRPNRDAEGLKRTFAALFNWSFVPNDYKRYHGVVPVIGSLYTLLLFPFLLLGVTKHGLKRVKTMRLRLVGLLGCTHLAIFLWYWTHHQDRYLQTLMPWIAAGTGAFLVLLWRSHVVVRLALIPLVGIQIAWGLDVPFIQTHAMIRSPLKKAMDTVELGYKKKYDQRFKAFTMWTNIEAKLPEDAHVLLHELHNRLGVGRTTVNDWQGWQYGLDYGSYRNTRELHDNLTKLGVTHMVWKTEHSSGWDTLAGDILWWDLAQRANKGKMRSSRMSMAALPAAPEDVPMAPVAIFGCKGGWATGLYSIDQLHKPVFGPRKKQFPKPMQDGVALELVKRAGFIGLDTHCKGHQIPLGEKGNFVMVAKRKQLRGRQRSRRGRRKHMQIWVRTRGTPEPL